MFYSPDCSYEGVLRSWKVVKFSRTILQAWKSWKITGCRKSWKSNVNNFQQEADFLSQTVTDSLQLLLIWYQ